MQFGEVDAHLDKGGLAQGLELKRKVNHSVSFPNPGLVLARVRKRLGMTQRRVVRIVKNLYAGIPRENRSAELST